MHLAFLAPMVRGGVAFYDLFADVMVAVARQLDIELELLGHGINERAEFIQCGRELATRATRPDCLVFANFLGVAPELIPELDKAGMATLLVVDGLSPSDRLALNRRGCSRFLGEIIPDDVEAGKTLAEILVAETRRRGLRGPDGKVHVSVLSGIHTMVSNLRFRGWTAVKDHDPGVVLDGVDFGGWDKPEATAAATMLLRRAPHTNVVWCFNDVMALGAVEAATAMNRKPGKDLLIGGIDLLDEALAAILQGVIHVSVGGHIIDGARALLHLHDRAQGDLTPLAQTTRLEPVRADEAARYMKFMKERGWRSADFTRFSARRNPGPSRPELSLRALVAG